MQGLVDTHAHLCSDAYEEDRWRVADACFAADGLSLVVDVATDLETARISLELAERYEGIRSAIGVHPHEARHYDEERLGEIFDLARSPAVVALGEMGLDFHYMHSPRDVQEEVFRLQLREALGRQMPIILHVRDAARETLRVLRDELAGQQVRGVWHCFSEDAAVAAEAVEMGLHVGVTGIVTFPRASTLREVARTVPLDRLLLETDCPYLSPVPHRGRRNLPGYVAHVARAVASERDVSVDSLVEETGANARRLFGVEG